MIYGHVPFKGKTEQQLREQIDKNNIIFGEYKNVCQQVKDFIRCCLINDSFKRISIKDMYKHPWIVKLKNKYRNI